jgi:pyruvate,water dikinase
MDRSNDEPLIVPLDSPLATVERVGGKAASLARLAAAGLPVPPGFHLTTSAYRRFVHENQLAGAIMSAAAGANAEVPATLESASAAIGSLFSQGKMLPDMALALSQWYQTLGKGNPAVAVRSSATAEDLPETSFAGQQDTSLNVRGSERLQDAVRRCWASLWTARAIGYRARLGIAPEDVFMAVIVERLVPAEAAGVLFTANPLTGARGEVMINAVWGLGEALVGGHVTPDTIVVNKRTGAIQAQEIADKSVMTARLAEGTHDEPVPAEKRKLAVLAPQQAGALARLGTRIEDLWGMPVDVEWALCDERLFVLQARPITALPAPPAELEWRLPRPKGRYVRSSVIELLPDPLSPLFATLAVPAWNDAYRELARSIGLARAMPESFIVTINDYAYYDASHFGVWQVLPALPRVATTGRRWIGRASSRWKDLGRPPYAAKVSDWSARDLSSASATQLLDGAREIARAAAGCYLSIQSGILPAAYMSEAIFSGVYNRLIKRKDDPPALTFLLGFDSAPILAEKSLFDLATWARTHEELAAYLTSTAGPEVAAAYQSASRPVADADAWQEFCARFSRHLDRFGHGIYELDFATAVPADEPAPLFEALKCLLAGPARNPYERQAQAAQARERAERALTARLKGLRRRWFIRLLRWAQRYAPLREDALADVGLGWPVLRRMLLEVGRRLNRAGAISRPGDIFWLTKGEAEAAARKLDADQRLTDFRHATAERRAVWNRERKVTPPGALPVESGARFWGIDFSRWMPARTEQPAGDVLRGVGASPGRVAGIARVILGPEDFGQMRAGDILTAKITTPAWTPLFALASGVVADVGGPLSHSSIVAREYQIPAVLGTGLATERIRSGQSITVDGDLGLVILGRSSPRAPFDAQECERVTEDHHPDV